MDETKEIISIQFEGKIYQETDCSKCHNPSWRLFNDGSAFLAKCKCGHVALLGGGSKPQGQAFGKSMKDII